MVLNILTLAISFHALGFNWLLQTLLTWHAGELCFVKQWAESSLSGKIYALQYNQQNKACAASTPVYTYVMEAEAAH